jgi:hypothetical protein
LQFETLSNAAANSKLTHARAHGCFVNQAQGFNITASKAAKVLLDDLA